MKILPNPQEREIVHYGLGGVLMSFEECNVVHP
jgi:hypothetical protein